MIFFQVWEEGDESYHQELMVPALLIHGAQDKFVTLEEEQWMQEVSEITGFNIFTSSSMATEPGLSHQGSFQDDRARLVYAQSTLSC